MKPVVIGTVGVGYAASLHGRGKRRHNYFQKRNVFAGAEELSFAQGLTR